jgi:small multidrug resistance pump
LDVVPGGAISKVPAVAVARSVTEELDEGAREQPPVMSKSHLALLLTLGFSLLGVVGDYFLKVASLSERPFRSAAFYLGFAVYASTAFGWLFAMRHLKLATISTVYSVCIVLLLTTLGVVVFNERLRPTEMLGIALALASLVLLVRFA